MDKKEELPVKNHAESEEIMGEKYICKDGYYQVVDNSCVANYMEPLLIDYSLLTSSSSSSSKSMEELQKFKSALTSWGCFQLINHGIPTSMFDEIRQVSKQFFELPMEEKKKYAMLTGGTNGFQGGAVPSPTKHVLDWNEGLNLTIFPEDRLQLQFWPQKPLNFKNVLHEYTTRLTAIFDVLFKLLFRTLNVDEKSFEKQYGRNKEINARFNYYPRCPGLKQVLGLKPHADFSAMTLVLQDEEGLQVLKDDQWFMVPVIPDALFLNLGDPVEIMSNGIFKSAVHRVVTNTEKERVSIDAFWDSDRDNEIGPLDELITADRPQLYQRISLKDYSSKFFPYYESGKRAINVVKI